MYVVLQKRISLMSFKQRKARLKQLEIKESKNLLMPHEITELELIRTFKGT